MGCGVGKHQLSDSSRTPVASGDNMNGFLMEIRNNVSTSCNDSVERAEPLRMLGREKYIKSRGAVVMANPPRSSESPTGLLLMFCALGSDELTFSYLEHSSRKIFGRRFTDKALEASKESAGVSFSWGPFFKSLASDMLKQKAEVCSVGVSEKVVYFTISNEKETSETFPFLCNLQLLSSQGDSSHRTKMFEYFIEPMTRLTQVRRRRADMVVTRGLPVEKLESEYRVQSIKMKQFKTKADELLTKWAPLRTKVSIALSRALELSSTAQSLRRKLYLLRDVPSNMDPLDAAYLRGGAQYFEHVAQAERYHPVENTVDEAITACIRAAFPLAAGASIESIMTVLNRRDLQPLLDKSDGNLVRDVFSIFCGVDRWDYDVFRLEVITNGNALFYTTYMILYKLNLVAHFGLNDTVLQRFLLGVQSGYHPNPYHNAVHAADVTQINYYIMMVAGLKEKCQLSPEELLASILAAAVHDFDHPGLNNNFHSRTNAHLSIIYNDRSTLENHHISSTFQLLRHPAYNVLAPLSSEQLRTVRDTMIEMVLATDMLNHGQIFRKFQIRMSESTDWCSSKEDVRLALSIGIKMADISNCCRPYHIYSVWARKIAQEFYRQGDAEKECNLSVSPFMDRSMEKTDFPKGQMSFIMCIVVPMLEAIAEFLPAMRFALPFCIKNTRAWQDWEGEFEHRTDQ
ncbi:putative 3', 5'-cyclic nucleotide phosphodiesterase [Trypanosoma vivax]|nr:putative 3', 5'-cyclic nucleotide phosphodiesterase [Trypanosoma vivax]